MDFSILVGTNVIFGSHSERSEESRSDFNISRYNVCRLSEVNRKVEFFQSSNIMKKGYVYILASKRNGTLYTGVTSDLFKRMYEHKNKVFEGFSSKYNVQNLVYSSFCKN